MVFYMGRHTLSEIEESEKSAKVETAYFDDLEANGFCVLEDILSAVEVFDIRKKLLAAARESNRTAPAQTEPGHRGCP